MHNTLEKAKQTQLRIGAMHAPPWVIIEGNMVTGIEAEIVKGFAQKYSIENYLGATKGTLTEKLCFNNMGFLALFI